ncbi:glutamate receptor 3.7-like [Aristolochia californica]|uniref:glutamate receptor 3.7-like n=1 Tax=Aristolochia californica TaxID=171875 RepID=UPI0035DEA6C5
MAIVVFLSLLVLILGNISSIHGQRPPVVNIGALFTYDSVIGRAAMVAMQAAVEDINADSSVLGGTKLNLIMENTNCNVFIGSIGAFRVLEKEAVAIIGPQSSAIAHMISFISTGLQVPLVSFAATDPTLSALQFPFFFRTTISDSYQMTAMADLINYYGWKEIIAFYVDDDYGRGGISFLHDELAKKMSRISYKLVIPVGATHDDITKLLLQSNVIGPRVYVVHVNPDTGLRIFDIARQLNMMTDDYVWLATDWLSAALDSLGSINHTVTNSLEGVVGLRQNSLESDQKKAFVSRWWKLCEKWNVTSGLNSYGFSAYDTVWIVARALSEYLKENRTISFSSKKELHVMSGAMLQMDKLKTFDGGSILCKKLMEINFNGLMGHLQFDSYRNLANGTYEVINIRGTKIQRIGYWSNYSHLSIKMPDSLNGKLPINLSEDQKLESVIWPSGKAEIPRGWVIANAKRPLRIGVPKRASYVEFVTEINDTHVMRGYCIDLFQAALKYIPYDVPHEFVPFGNGRENPNYDELVKKVSDNTFGAAVGDIAIVRNRTKLVDFTQPYISTGLVIVAPIKISTSNAWVFLRPFTVEMWCATGASFLLIGGVIWLLEHRVNDDFRGPPRQQLINTVLFSFSTLFKTQQESTMSSLGKMVMMVWLFLLMVITSSYTASLTSILTVQQLSSPITGIDSLISSNGRIGFQVGSFALSYLRDSLNIRESRLVSLKNPQEYERALRLGSANGGVAAIIDELPYVELFLSKMKRSDISIIGQMFTKSGWGFAFQRDSPLAVDMSVAILKLSENGELQKIHDRWLCKGTCATQRGYSSEANQLHLESFAGLFIFCGLAICTSLLVFLQRAIRQYVRYKREQRELGSSLQMSSNTNCSKAFISFFDFIDEKEEAIKRMFRNQEDSQPQV